MRFVRPQSLTGLILVGFGLVALPLVIAVVWALFSLDRLAEQSEQLVTTGVSAAENNQLLAEQGINLERVARQYLVLRDSDSLTLLRQDLGSFEATLDKIGPQASNAGAMNLSLSIRSMARRVVFTMAQGDISDGEAQVMISEFTRLRQRVLDLTKTLSAYIDQELNALKESTRHAQQVSAWQTAALIPGTLILVLYFTLLVARPIRQIDRAISQLGKKRFFQTDRSKGPKGPRAAWPTA